jgi:anti-anti-sigma factor
VLLPSVEQGTTVLDMTGVGFCDSSGLHVLTEAQDAARANGAVLRLAALSSAVTQILTMSGELELFDVYPDTEAALKD